jgi:hypothetical protein
MSRIKRRVSRGNSLCEGPRRVLRCQAPTTKYQIIANRRSAHCYSGCRANPQMRSPRSRPLTPFSIDLVIRRGEACGQRRARTQAQWIATPATPDRAYQPEFSSHQSWALACAADCFSQISRSLSALGSISWRRAAGSPGLTAATNPPRPRSSLAK